MSTEHFTAKPPQPLPRSWLGRNWWFVPVSLLGLILLAGGLGYLYVQSLKQTEPYQNALAEVKKSPQAMQKLGDSIEDATWIPQGSIEIKDDDRGEAKYHFDVKGPKGTGRVSTHSRKIDGKWGLLELTVTLLNDEKIDVMKDVKLPEDGGAPKFDPGKQPESKSDGLQPPGKIDIKIPGLPETK